MKKLLSIFISFSITMPATLSMISCQKNIKQQTVNETVNCLNDLIIVVIVDDGNEASIKNAIVMKIDMIEKLTDSKIKIASFTFIKDGNKFQTIFQNNEEYEVILKLKKTNNKEEENTVNFKIKVIISNDQMQLEKAVLMLNQINNKEIYLPTVDLNNFFQSFNMQLKILKNIKMLLWKII